MFVYNKKLQYPVRIKNPNPQLAKIIITQYGGPDGELGASLRYLSQRFSMPYPELKGLLTDIGTEELGHIEIICAMVHQLTKGATIDELERVGLGGHYSEHGYGLFPTNADGETFSVKYINATGDPLAELSENMAAEQKARAVYENLINLTDDKDVIDVLLFLRQREIVHFNRFKELYEEYKQKGYK